MLDLSGPVEQVWAAVSSLCDLGPLDRATVERLRKVFFAEASIAAGPLVPLVPLVPLGRPGLAAVRGAQRYLVRDGGDGALSVGPVTVSEH